MKSLGSDAYIDHEHPEEPPAHISKAIEEALGDLNLPGPTPKPTEAAMPEKTPPASEDRSQHISNGGQAEDEHATP